MVQHSSKAFNYNTWRFVLSGFIDEHPEKNSWWVNELDSLGVDTKGNSNELKNKQENRNLVEAIKREFMEEYKQTYDQSS